MRQLGDVSLSPEENVSFFATSHCDIAAKKAAFTPKSSFGNRKVICQMER